MSKDRLLMILKRWLPAVIIMAFIFVASSLPGATVSSNGDVDYSAHKLTHFVIYFLLSVAFYRATKSAAISVLLTVIYGISDEYHQLYTPTRNGNFIDILVDSFAAITAGILLWKYFHLLPVKLQTWLSE